MNNIIEQNDFKQLLNSQKCKLLTKETNESVFLVYSRKNLGAKHILIKHSNDKNMKYFLIDCKKTKTIYDFRKKLSYIEIGSLVILENASSLKKVIWKWFTDFVSKNHRDKLIKKILATSYFFILGDVDKKQLSDNINVISLEPYSIVGIENIINLILEKHQKPSNYFGETKNKIINLVWKKQDLDLIKQLISVVERNALHKNWKTSNMSLYLENKFLILSNITVVEAYFLLLLHINENVNLDFLKKQIKMSRKDMTYSLLSLVQKNIVVKKDEYFKLTKKGGALTLKIDKHIGLIPLETLIF